MSTIKALTQTVLKTLEEEPNGAPETPLYLAFQQIGVTLETFTLFMMSLERLALIKRSGHVLHITPKGRQWLAARSTELLA